MSPDLTPKDVTPKDDPDRLTGDTSRSIVNRDSHGDRKARDARPAGTIVQAALSLVASDGLDHVSVARVARRIGVVPSALYRHFSGKDEIVDALLAAVLERLEDNARAAREEAGDALGRIRALLVRHVAMITEHPGLPRLVLSEDVYAGRPARRDRMFKGISRYLERVAAFVREGSSAGNSAPTSRRPPPPSCSSAWCNRLPSSAS